MDCGGAQKFFDMIKYHLFSSAGKVPSSARAQTNGTQTMEKEVIGGKVEGGRSPEAVSGPSSILADDNVQKNCLAQVSTVKNLISEDRVVRVTHTFLI